MKRSHGTFAIRKVKNTIQRFLLLALAAISTGCASTGGYFIDRGHDAADIFTVTVGVGAGTKARIGPIQAGLLYQRDSIGLRSGAFFARRPSLSLEDDRALDINLLICGVESSNTGDEIVRRGKEFNTFNVIVPVAIVEPQSSQLNPEYFFQVEALIGLGPTVRVGLNFGELLDFLLGWTTIDIFGDDIETKNSNIERVSTSP
jgi:hypothetical protein